MKQCPFLLRLCQEVLLRATRWFFFFSCFLCRKRKVNAESVSLPHKWNKRPHTAGNPGRMIVATRLDKSRRIGKQSYSLCCGLPFSRFRWCLFPFGDSFFTDFPLKFFLPNLPPLPFTSIFASFSEPHQAVISVLGAKVIPGLDGKARSSLLFSAEISSPSGSISPKNLAFPNPYLFKHPKRKRPMRQKDA